MYFRFAKKIQALYIYVSMIFVGSFSQGSWDSVHTPHTHTHTPLYSNQMDLLGVKLNAISNS